MSFHALTMMATRPGLLPSLQPFLLASLFLLCSSCMQVDIEPKFYTDLGSEGGEPEVSEDQDYASLQEQGLLRFEGDDVHNERWIVATNQFRFVRRGIQNRSGSLAELLEPAIIEALKKAEILKNLRSHAMENEAGNSEIDTMDEGPSRICTVVVRVPLQRTTWYPPREPVQTFRPRREGRLHMSYHFSVHVMEGSPPRSRCAELFEPFEFVYQQDHGIFPGEESEAMAIYIHTMLRRFIEEFESHIGL